jgi:hypothetical protein
MMKEYTDEQLARRRKEKAREGYRQVTRKDGCLTVTTSRLLNEEDVEGLVGMITEGKFGKKVEDRQESADLRQYLKDIVNTYP